MESLHLADAAAAAAWALLPFLCTMTHRTQLFKNKPFIQPEKEEKESTELTSTLLRYKSTQCHFSSAESPAFFLRPTEEKSPWESVSGNILYVKAGGKRQKAEDGEEAANTCRPLQSLPSGQEKAGLVNGILTSPSITSAWTGPALPGATVLLTASNQLFKENSGCNNNGAHLTDCWPVVWFSKFVCLLYSNTVLLFVLSLHGMK